MKILYDNMLKTATLTATNENSNYPVANLFHKWKKKYFQATANSCVITAVLPSAVTVTSVALSYHNLSACTVRGYNAADELISAWTIPVNAQTTAYYSTVAAVKKVTITCNSSATVFVGSLFVGTSLSISKSADQNIPLDSTDVPTISSDGQVSGRTSSILRGANVTLPILTYTERQAIETVFTQCGLIVPFFLDLWDLSHTQFPPLYGRFASGLSVSHGKDGDTVSFDFKECN